MLVYTKNGQEGECELIFKCSRACDEAVPSHDQCKQPGRKDVTCEMLETYVVSHGAGYSFIRGKGPTFIITTKAGGYTMYSARHEKEMKAKNADLQMRGSDFKFRPFRYSGGVSTDIPFELFFDILKSSGARRNQYENVVFCPDTPGIPAVVRREMMAPGDFNLFNGLRIDCDGAIQGCVVAAVIPAEHSTWDFDLIVEFYEKAGVLTGQEDHDGRIDGLPSSSNADTVLPERGSDRDDMAEGELTPAAQHELLQYHVLV
jgi:hypothetical protein